MRDRQFRIGMMAGALENLSWPEVKARREPLSPLALCYHAGEAVKTRGTNVVATAPQGIAFLRPSHSKRARYLDDIQVTIAFSVPSLVVFSVPSLVVKSAWPSCKHMHMLAACTHTLCLPLEPHGYTMTKAECEAKALEIRPSPTRAQPWAVGNGAGLAASQRPQSTLYEEAYCVKSGCSNRP